MNMENQQQQQQQQGHVQDNLRYVELLRHISRGDWEAAKRTFDSDPSTLTARITEWQETPLHTAINTSRSLHFIRSLINLLPETSLGLRDTYGGSPLHNAAIVGNVEVAKMLVHKSPGLLQLRNNNFGDSPLHSAARYGHRDAVSYLLSVTRDDEPSPFRGKDGASLLNLLIVDDFYGLALEVMRRFPSLAREEDGARQTAMLTLAERPQAFPSGARIGHCRRFWRHCESLVAGKSFTKRIHHDTENPAHEQRISAAYESVEHKQTMELLRLLISETLKANTAADVDRLLAPAITMAAASGIYEIVTEIIKGYPNAIWFCDGNGHYIFHLAVIYRQEKIFNILYQMGASKNFATALLDRSTGNNLLHLAGRLGRTEMIPGAALKVQRELQWFDEVEKMVQPSYRQMKNPQLMTPKSLFTEAHKELIKEGEKWMKDTAGSCSLVAVLVVTVAFAAAFTLPGGSNDAGIPNYLNRPSFIVFIAADTLALFSSSTSLLMFLGILTSRYSERDFVRSLPMKMGIGLLTLFLSLAAMLTAFGAALHIVLFHKVRWILAPIGLVACVPSILFVFLQFPLLVELVFSTFGPSIFGKQSDEIIA